jgi:hypothetical protein
MLRDAYRVREPIAPPDEPEVKVTLETPSHNGPYKGTAEVRTLPAGISGEDILAPKAAYLARNERQKALAIANVGTCQYRKCKKPLPTNRLHRQGKYCSSSCYEKEFILRHGAPRGSLGGSLSKWERL